MKIAKIGDIVLSVLFCVAGILFTAMSEVSTTMILYIGVATTLFCIVKLIGYFSKDLFRLAFQFDLEFGIPMIVLGVIVKDQSPDVIVVDAFEIDGKER